MEPWELSAREQVRDTYAAYNHAGDRFRLSELVACFAADGILEVKGQPAVQGRDAILGFLSGARTTAPESVATEAVPAEVPVIRHFVANLAFTSLTPARIESSAYFQVYTQHGPDHWGRYRDVLVPEDGGWRFAHRLVAVDSAVPGGWYASQL